MAEEFNHRVQVFRSDGAFAFEFGGRGTADGRLDAPHSADYSPSGDYIAVADSGNDRVQVFHAANGTFAFKFGGNGTADGGFDAPTSVSYSPSGDYIAVADSGNDRVQVFHAANGTFAFKFGGHGTGDGPLKKPASAAFVPLPPPPDMLAVADPRNHRVHVLYANGTHVLEFGKEGRGRGELVFPSDVAYSPDGARIAVADYGNHRVQVFRPDGTLDFAFGLPGMFDGQFRHPSGVAYSPDGARIAVADYGNHRVQVFHAANGTLDFDFGRHPFLLSPTCRSPHALSGICSVNGTDYLAAELMRGDGLFSRPWSVAYSPSGDRLAVADRGNDRVQVFYPNGAYELKFGEKRH